MIESACSPEAREDRCLCKNSWLRHLQPVFPLLTTELISSGHLFLLLSLHRRGWMAFGLRRPPFSCPHLGRLFPFNSTSPTDCPGFFSVSTSLLTSTSHFLCLVPSKENHLPPMHTDRVTIPTPAHSTQMPRTRSQNTQQETLINQTHRRYLRPWAESRHSALLCSVLLCFAWEDWDSLCDCLLP